MGYILPKNAASIKPRAVHIYLFGPISISEAAHLFTKQLLCQLSYAGVL
jgi:hypothetical protein